MSGRLFVSIALIASACADIVSTLVAKNAGAVEANPLLKWFGRYWIAPRVVITVVAVWMVWSFDLVWAGVVVTILWVFLAYWNLRNMHHLKGGGKQI